MQLNAIVTSFVLGVLKIENKIGSDFSIKIVKGLKGTSLK